MKTQDEHLRRLNSIPRSEEWRRNISLAKRNGGYVACRVCGNRVYRNQSQQKRSPNTYCSWKCAGAIRRGKLFSEDQKRKLSEGLVQRWANPSFREKMKGKHAGKRNRSWKGGKKLYWRDQVFKRDNYTCKECGLRDDTRGFMDADHILCRRDNPELQYSIENGQTLCPNCHRRKTIQNHEHTNGKNRHILD